MSEINLRLPVKTISKLIAELSALQDRVRSGERLELPTVTLWLNSGQSLCGIVVRAVAAPPPDCEATLLLQSRDVPMDMHYITIAAIQSVTVHYTDRSLSLLSDGKIRENAGRVPARLELERQARSISAQLDGIEFVILWDELPRSDLAFQSLERLLQDLQTILSAIRSDHLGITSLQAKVTRIVIRIDPIARVCLKEQILEIRVGVAENDLICQPKHELQQAIERLL
jgi:hypothetical protein